MIRTISAASILFFAAPNLVNAQGVLSRFDVNTVLAAAQCELGIYAKQTRYSASTPDRWKARVIVEGKEIRTQEYRGGIPIIGGGYTQTITNRWKRTAPRNIHPDNTEACARNRPSLGLTSCLMSQTPALRSTSDYAECETTVSAVGNGRLGGAIEWIMKVELSAAASLQRQFTVTILAPPPPK